MHTTCDLVLGRISARGVKPSYTQAATPVCSLLLEVDKPGRDGKVYTGYHKVEITGKFAEACVEELEAGDEILVEGEHQCCSTVDPKPMVKKTTCVLSTWGMSQRVPAAAPVEHKNKGHAMIEVTLRGGFYIVSLPKSILVLTKAEFLQALRQGRWWPRTATMDGRRSARS